MPGSTNDDVFFNVPLAGPCTLDVPIVGNNSIEALGFNTWGGTLTLNNSLLVKGGGFALDSGATIDLTGNSILSLADLTGVTEWTTGTITGTNTSTFVVSGSALTVTAQAGAAVKTLGTNMLIMASPITDNAGSVTLVRMTDNLRLVGSAYIDVAAGGYLNLWQDITAVGLQNTEGGLDTANIPQIPAVQVEVGGTFQRMSGGDAVSGVINQVMIEGAVYNLGGSVSVGPGVLMDLATAGGTAYWQKDSAQASLTVSSGGNISGVDNGTGNGPGTFQIDTGTVTLTAPSGGAADELDSGGLIFGSDDSGQTLAIVDSTPGTSGTVTIQGPVTLSYNTTTTMNFTGGNNTADLIDVKNGALTVAGRLVLNATDRTIPTKPLNFLDDSNPLGVPSLTGSFSSITDNVNLLGTDSGAMVPNNAQLLYYQVTFNPPGGGGGGTDNQ
jgi:hypothetical protein